MQEQLRQTGRFQPELSHANGRLHSVEVAERQRAAQAEADRNKAERGRLLGMQQAEHLATHAKAYGFRVEELERQSENMKA